jgi:hypothetical protein
MTDKKISQLANATTPLAGTEVLPIVQSGATVKVSVDNLTAGKTVKATSFDTDVAAAGVTLSGVTLAADGTDTNIDINITPKGTGEVNLTKVDIDAGAIDGTAIGANSASSGAFSTLSATGNVGFDGGTFVFNDSGADKDFRIEGDTDANLVFTDASTDRVGLGTNTPTSKLDVVSPSNVVSTYRSNTARSRRYVQSIVTTSNTDVTIDVDTGVAPAIFTIVVNAMSYTAGVGYHVYGVGRGYLFSSPGFGIGFATLSNSGLTCALSFVDQSTVRVTITDTVSADAKSGVCEIVVSAI